ncbi:hypothetical protein MMPV_004462 [Pyropia vietnamensis]
MASANDADDTRPHAAAAPAGERAKSTADLDRVTDYVEETEVDTAALSASVAGLTSGAAGASSSAGTASGGGSGGGMEGGKAGAGGTGGRAGGAGGSAKRVKVRPEDVKVVVAAMGCTATEAEAALGMGGGVVATLTRLVHE